MAFFWAIGEATLCSVLLMVLDSFGAEVLDLERMQGSYYVAATAFVALRRVVELAERRETRG